MFECDPSILCLYAFSLNTLHHIGVTLDITKKFQEKSKDTKSIVFLVYRICKELLRLYKKTKVPKRMISQCMAGRLLNFLGRRREEKLSKPRIAQKALIICHCLFILIKPSGIFQSTTFPTTTSTFTTSTTFD